jgi:hypothetical protein
VPLTEIMFMAAVVVGCLFLLRWIRTGRAVDLICAALSITCSSSIRYEGWIFAACFLLYGVWKIILHRKDTSIRIHRLPVGLVLIFPLCWIALQLVQAQHPLGFLTTPGSNYRVVYGNSFPGIIQHSVIVQFIEQNSASWNILGVVGLISILRQRPDVRSWLWVPGGAFCVMTILSLSGRALPNHSFWRVAAVWGALCVPFTAHWIIQQRRISTRIPILVAILMMIQFCGQSVKMTSYADFTPDERTAGEFCGSLIAHSGNQGVVLVETSSWQYLHLMVASGHPDSFLFNTGRDPSFPSAPVIGLTASIAHEDLIRRNVRWLVFRTDALKEALLHNGSVVGLKEFGPWMVFELR